MRPVRWFYTVPLRLRSLFRRKQVDQELDEEIRYHVDQRIEQEIARGLTPEEARTAILRAMGGLGQRKEECRDMRGVNFIEDLIKDLSYAIRTLRKSPVFTSVAVLSLALGIGANTAIFSLIDAVLLASLPVRDPEQLRLVSEKPSQPLSYPLYKYISGHNEVFSGAVAFHAFANWNVSTTGESELMTGQLVSGNYFQVLGINPTAGRLLSPEDDRMPGGHAVAVISFSLWRQLFGLNPAAIGKDIRIYGRPFTIIGVTPPEFYGTQTGFMPEVTIPLRMQRSVLPMGSLLDDSSDARWLYVMGRLRTGMSEQHARASLNVLFQQFLVTDAGQPITSEKRREFSRQTLELASGSQGFNQLRRRFSFPLRILMSVVGLILLIACANLANLLLARASARQREIAIRLAIGARRLRLIRQLLTESLFLAFLGGALGLSVAYWADAVLVRFFAIELKIQPRLEVLGFSAVLCLLSGIMFGLAPALRATCADLATALKRAQAGRGPRELERWLITAQVSLSLLLLAGAALFVRSLRNLENLDAGFNRANVLLVNLDPRFSGYQGQRIAELYKDLLAKAETIPGVQSATLVSDIPVNDLSWFQEFAGPDPTVRRQQVSLNHVGARFFETFGIPILEGRDFNLRDNERAPKVIAISEAVARHYFPHHDPIGRTTNLGTIAAVVKDVKYESLRGKPLPVIYRPFLQEPDSWEGTTLALRTAGDALRSTPLVRRAIYGIDPNLAILGISTMVQQVNGSLRQERLFAALTSVLGLLALLLVSIGLYGIVGYTVGQRVNEIGIRMALGAKPAGVVWLIMRDSLWLAGSGLVIGVPLALAAARSISSLLFGLSPVDLLSLASPALLLLLFAALAGYLPARRASQVDPVAALRFE